MVGVVAFVALGAAVLFLLLCVLGALRESAILRGEVKALSDLVRNPPPPSYVGEAAPDALRNRLPREYVESGSKARIVAFVSPGCQPCERLVDGLTEATQAGKLSAEDILWIVWAQSSDQIGSLAQRIPGHVIEDAQGTLSRACEVRATPTLLALSISDHTVIDYNLEGDVQWTLSQLTHPVPLAA